MGKTDGSEVHRAVGQVVLAADVADLLGLHGLQFGTVSDPMAKAPAEGTATLSWRVRGGSGRSQIQDPASRMQAPQKGPPKYPTV